MNSYNNQYRRPANPCGQEPRPIAPELCGFKKGNYPLGMTYVPMQRWGDIYSVEDGFQCGTIFKELNLPFTGRRMC